jgi:hypothetical protein
MMEMMATGKQMEVLGPVSLKSRISDVARRSNCIWRVPSKAIGIAHVH